MPSGSPNKSGQPTKVPTRGWIYLYGCVEKVTFSFIGRRLTNDRLSSPWPLAGLRDSAPFLSFSFPPVPQPTDQITPFARKIGSPSAAHRKVWSHFSLPSPEPPVPGWEIVFFGTLDGDCFHCRHWQWWQSSCLQFGAAKRIIGNHDLSLGIGVVSASLTTDSAIVVVVYITGVREGFPMCGF